MTSPGRAGPSKLEDRMALRSARYSSGVSSMVNRICLDVLRRQRSRREQLAGSWLPEPISIRAGADGGPEPDALMADTVGLALLVVLESLTPPERLAFVLHDVFGIPFAQIAPVLERSPAARGSSRAGELPARGRLRAVIVNGAPGVVLRFPARSLLGALTVVNGRIVEIDLIADPDKLRGLPPG